MISNIKNINFFIYLNILHRNKYLLTHFFPCINNELFHKVPLNSRFNFNLSLGFLLKIEVGAILHPCSWRSREHASRSILFRGGGMVSLSCRHEGKIGIMRNKTKKMRRCDTTARTDCHLFVPAAPLRGEESRSFSINAPPRDRC